MIRLFILSAIFLVTISAEKCNERKNTSEVYKARLEVKAICMNYTVKLLEGNMDASKIVSNWTDETTKRSYTKVFALKNPCSFPSTIKQGDEFYFIIEPGTNEQCAVCMAYYPVPPKMLSIKIINK
jgi:hypothetical protein